MSDTTTVWDVARGLGDWQLSGAQLRSGNDLATAVLISLFTDRVAAADDVIPDGSTDPRGWCGDDPAAPIGSRLWLLGRAKQLPETLIRARHYIAEALQWLLDDGVVARFDITTEWSRPAMLGSHIVAYKKDGTHESFRFDWAWQQVS